MSDSDCSNCEKECDFRYLNSYHCYVKQFQTIQKHIKSKDMSLMKKLSLRLEELYAETEDEDVYQTNFYLKKIIDMYEEGKENE